ncbi:PIN domain-like protein [Podospora australis]|uniref:PIN domain-like protein n=1 Tax=Podospora australis TaxID=1536484 RepID=A0AAN6X429_9PEZI|nr:PIN domain-like protein [Podospora australis]
MGINNIWAVLSRSSWGSLAEWSELSAGHYAKDRRPLTVAVDTLHWLLGERVPGHDSPDRNDIITIANTVGSLNLEKFKMGLFRLLSLNIYLVFVFDGPGAGNKRSEILSILRDDLDTLKEVLHHLGIHMHYAPAGALSECVQMQTSGLVDAVWSYDSNIFMSDCTLLLHHPRAGSRGDSEFESERYTVVYNLEDMREKCGMDSSRMVLLALLWGYDGSRGLLADMPLEISLAIARTVPDPLPERMCHESTEMDMWRATFQAWLDVENYAGIELPDDFPDRSLIHRFTQPTVTSSEYLPSPEQLWCGYSKSVDPAVLALHNLFARNNTFNPPDHNQLLISLAEGLAGIQLNRELTTNLGNIRGKYDCQEIHVLNSFGPKATAVVYATLGAVLPAFEKLAKDSHLVRQRICCGNLLKNVLERLLLYHNHAPGTPNPTALVATSTSTGKQPLQSVEHDLHYDPYEASSSKKARVFTTVAAEIPSPHSLYLPHGFPSYQCAESSVGDEEEEEED